MNTITVVTEHRTCQYCQRPIKGRTDKRYCNDGCRNAVNNKLYAPTNNIIRNISHALLKNRRILSSLMERHQKATITIMQLVAKGYRMEYHTEIVKTRHNSEQVFCFEYGYQLKADNKIKLIRKTIV